MIASIVVVDPTSASDRFQGPEGKKQCVALIGIYTHPVKSYIVNTVVFQL